MNNNWLKYYLDDENEYSVTIYDQNNTIHDSVLSFTYLGEDISTLTIDDQVKYQINSSDNDYLEFIREIDLIPHREIRILYTERLRIYRTDTGIFGYIKYKIGDNDYWEKIIDIYS